MAIVRSKLKLAAHNEENCEDHPRSNLAQDSTVHRAQKDYITQVSEKIEGRVKKSCPRSSTRRRTAF